MKGHLCIHLNLLKCADGEDEDKVAVTNVLTLEDVQHCLYTLHELG
jgi:hypothetical protein